MFVNFLVLLKVFKFVDVEEIGYVDVVIIFIFVV